MEREQPAGRHPKARPGPPAGYRSVGSHTPDPLCGEHGGPLPARGSLAPAREQRLVVGRRDLFVSS
jgi:hypothetical protein